LNSLCFSNKKIFTEIIEDKGRILNPEVLFDQLTGSQSPHEQCGLFCFEQTSRARSCKDAKSKKAKQQELLRRALSKATAKRMLRSNHPGLWVRQLRRGCDQREQSKRPIQVKIPISN